MDLLTEVLKLQDNLQTIEFKLGDKEYTWYFRYMTLLEKQRITDMCTKLETTLNADGSTTNKYVKNESVMPIHAIIEKALDKDGKRLFSHTNPDHFRAISLFPAEPASLIAYQLSRDIMGTLTPKEKDE